MWIVDFGIGTGLEEASQYEQSFSYIQEHVKLHRKSSRTTISSWWLHERPRPELRDRLRAIARFIVTIGVAKHRLFAWMESPTLPDHALFAFARSDDCFFGVLHSRIHEVWALRMGTQLETRPRYTPTSCFETFPLPECVWAAGDDGNESRLAAAGTAACGGARADVPSAAKRHTEQIAVAARELDELRNRWLNPPEWTKTEVLEFPGSVDGPWSRYIDPATVRAVPGVDAGAKQLTPGIGTVRWPRVMPKDPDCAESLKKRTLTNLYNQRPAWLRLAHEKLDVAVFAAYGWNPAIGDEELLAKLLELNLAGTGAKESPAT